MLTETHDTVEDDMTLHDSGLLQWSWQILCNVSSYSSSGKVI